MIQKTHLINIYFQTFENVSLESIKKRFNINVLTFLLKYLINDSKKKILKTFFWVPLKKHLLNVSFET